MDAQGKHTDRYGVRLEEGMPVLMYVDNAKAGEIGTGRVKALPPAGNDWYGFPLVTFDHDGRDRRVADTALLVDEAARVQVVNQLGTFRVSADELDLVIERHLPATIVELRQAYDQAGGDLDVSDVDTVTELLAMIACAKRGTVTTGHTNENTDENTDGDTD